MPTPLATIADALIEFILSLLRDPSALAEFEAAPEETLARQGLGNVCVDDVRSVTPVVVDRPDVTPVVAATPAAPTIIKTVPVMVPQPAPPPAPPQVVQQSPVVKEILNVANNFNIDNRSTIVDQSVNQNIWAQGDVTQIFDQEAVLALGDNSIAVGDDVNIDNSETDVTIGDVSIGNTTTDVEITDSFNDESTDVLVDLETEATDSFNDESTNTTVDVTVDDSFQVNDSFQAQTETVVQSEVTVVDSTVYADSAAYADPAAYAAEPAYDAQVVYEAPAVYETAPAALEVVAPLDMEYDETQ
ncbi:MAG: IniB N-terminal domain-containing protein [Brooklawnia sp.]|uniref:IniB N-terminal domain-containing protein n=1 Tax=Brooklawnia sp. TaxID=2699740 RepID=UPI003C73017B